MGTASIDILCEHDMNYMFMLIEIEFRHRIGANSVTDCMGFMMDCMNCMGYLCIESTVKVESSRLDSVRLTGLNQYRYNGNRT